MPAKQYGGAIMSGEPEEKSPTTADLEAAAQAGAQREVDRDRKEPLIELRSEDEQLAPLFLPDVAKGFRSRWDDVQRSFVDDPRQAVREADELVAQVMKSLAETFSNERAKLEAQVDQTDKASTENLRIALRRYRSFFERLLSL
jgi:hypothetical protein